ncbi:unnamed protein product [Rangifer tarandus platyrhynchus]|uniref:Uncharacterized protein n=2 Tax=Rangifer tarandus platyrhynchus TaxID=3082113 RepID=A0ABN8ZNR8_RANTA|nr:unnamed protein product [Rangifer tarandus platyrhynchus]CAI9707090.1 unnamed protein product [Rangifer tarandus platyrhynchus]
MPGLDSGCRLYAPSRVFASVDAFLFVFVCTRDRPSARCVQARPLSCCERRVGSCDFRRAPWDRPRAASSTIPFGLLGNCVCAQTPPHLHTDGARGPGHGTCRSKGCPWKLGVSCRVRSSGRWLSSRLTSTAKCRNRRQSRLLHTEPWPSGPPQASPAETPSDTFSGLNVEAPSQGKPPDALRLSPAPAYPRLAPKGRAQTHKQTRVCSGFLLFALQLMTLSIISKQSRDRPQGRGLESSPEGQTKEGWRSGLTVEGASKQESAGRAGRERSFLSLWVLPVLTEA